MADNPLVDLAQTVMIEKYGLDEQTYSLISFSESAKTVTIGMSDGYIPVRASFPREFLRYEEMKRWSDEKKEMFVRSMIAEGKEIPEEVLDAFHHIMLKVEMPTDEDIREKVRKEELGIGEDRAIKDDSVEDSSEEVSEEETAEEFEQKVEGKRPKSKLKLGKKKK